MAHETDAPVDDRDDRDGTPASVGLSVLRARDVDVAVIFRRGPTKQVRMIRWELRTDQLVRGQWLAGRVYAYASRITPDGRYVEYQGMRRGDPWRAIAKPPYFTPLAVWGYPDGWVSSVEEPLPAWLTTWWQAEVRVTWQPAIDSAPFQERALHPTHAALELQRRPAVPVRSGYASGTDRHSHVFRLLDVRRELAYDLGTADWGDWHPSGDVVLARDGALVRIPITHHRPAAPRTIADFTGETFEKLAPPPDALRW